MNEFFFESGRPKFFLIGLLILLILGEMLWSYRNNKNLYHWRDTLTNILIFAGFQFSKLLFFSFELAIGAFFSKYALFQLQKNAWVFVLCFILVDFIYYWYHRFSHKVKFLWAFHLIHHSSLYINLTVSYRLNWFSVILTPLFYAPLLLLGFPIEFGVRGLSTLVISTDREKSHKKLKVFQFEFNKQDVISPAVEMTVLKNFII